MLVACSDMCRGRRLPIGRARSGKTWRPPASDCVFVRARTKTQSVAGGLQVFPDLALPIGNLRPLHISEHATSILVSRVFPPDEQLQPVRTQVLTHRAG